MHVVFSSLSSLLHSLPFSSCSNCILGGRHEKFSGPRSNIAFENLRGYEGEEMKNLQSSFSVF